MLLTYFAIRLKGFIYILLLFLFAEKNLSAQDSVIQSQTEISNRNDTIIPQVDTSAPQAVIQREQPVVQVETIQNNVLATDTVKIDSIIIAVPYLISDSLMSVIDTAKHTVEWKEPATSVFKPEPPGKILIKNSGRQPQWIFVLLILQLLVLIYLKTSYFKRIEEYIRAYFNVNLSQQLFRDQESVLSFQVIVMMLNFLMSCSMLIYLFIDYYFQPAYINSFAVFLQIIIGVTIIYSAKYAGYLSLQNVFPFSDEISLFSFNYFLNQKLVGVVLIPFIYTAAYGTMPISKYFLFISALLFLLSIGIRSFKGILIGAKHLRKNPFHFLLYICTFEIAPLLILIKWLQTLANGQN
jgi:hypothetical protein